MSTIFKINIIIKNNLYNLIIFKSLDCSAFYVVLSC